MFYLSKFLPFVTILLTISSCGQRGVSEDEELYIQAKRNLNNKDYYQANEIFGRLVEKNPSKRLYKQYWADSYLGMGGFELFDFLISIDSILSRSLESTDLISEVKSFTNKYLFIGKKEEAF